MKAKRLSKINVIFALIATCFLAISVALAALPQGTKTVTAATSGQGVTETVFAANNYEVWTDNANDPDFSAQLTTTALTQVGHADWSSASGKVNWQTNQILITTDGTDKCMQFGFKDAVAKTDVYVGSNGLKFSQRVDGKTIQSITFELKLTIASNDYSIADNLGGVYIYNLNDTGELINNQQGSGGYKIPTSTKLNTWTTVTVSGEDIASYFLDDTTGDFEGIQFASHGVGTFGADWSSLRIKSISVTYVPQLTVFNADDYAVTTTAGEGVWSAGESTLNTVGNINMTVNQPNGAHIMNSEAAGNFYQFGFQSSNVWYSTHGVKMRTAIPSSAISAITFHLEVAKTDDNTTQTWYNHTLTEAQGVYIYGLGSTGSDGDITDKSGKTCRIPTNISLGQYTNFTVNSTDSAFATLMTNGNFEGVQFAARDGGQFFGNDWLAVHVKSISVTLVDGYKAVSYEYPTDDGTVNPATVQITTGEYTLPEPTAMTNKLAFLGWSNGTVDADGKTVLYAPGTAFTATMQFTTWEAVYVGTLTNGAWARLSSSTSGTGMRFQVSLSETEYDNYGSVINEIGIILLPTDMIGEKDFTKENYNVSLASDNAEEIKGKVDAKGSHSLVGLFMPEEHVSYYNRSFSARGYIDIITGYDAEQKPIITRQYSDLIVERSLYEIMDCVLDLNLEWSDEGTYKIAMQNSTQKVVDSVLDISTVEIWDKDVVTRNCAISEDNAVISNYRVETETKDDGTTQQVIKFEITSNRDTVYTGLILNGERIKYDNGNGFTVSDVTEITDESTTITRYTRTITVRKSVMNVLAGKQVSILGDSISTFNGYSNVATYNTNVYVPTATENPVGTGTNAYYYESATDRINDVNQTYWQQLINKLSMNLCVNNSLGGGGTISDQISNSDYANRNGAYLRAAHLKNNAGGSSINPDIILVNIGMNDLDQTKGVVTCGTVDTDFVADGTVTPTTFAEAYEIMLYRLTTMYGNDVEIFCATLPRNAYHNYKYDGTSATIVQDGAAYDRANEFNTVIRTLCAEYGVNVVELASIYEYSHSYTIDNIHPNEAGMDLISDIYYKSIYETFANKASA